MTIIWRILKAIILLSGVSMTLVIVLTIYSFLSSCCTPMHLAHVNNYIADGLKAIGKISVSGLTVDELDNDYSK